MEKYITKDAQGIYIPKTSMTQAEAEAFIHELTSQREEMMKRGCLMSKMKYVRIIEIVYRSSYRNINIVTLVFSVLLLCSCSPVTNNEHTNHEDSFINEELETGDSDASITDELEIITNSDELEVFVTVKPPVILSEQSANVSGQWRWLIEPGTIKNLFFIDDSKVVVYHTDGKLYLLDLVTDDIKMVYVETISEYKEGYSMVRIDEETNYIDSLGKLLCTNFYESGLLFNERFAAVKLESKWGYIDTNGEIVIDIVYDEVKSFSEGIASVKKDNRWGLINEKGENITDYLYCDTKETKSAMTAVCLTGKWGFVNSDGVNISGFVYDDVRNFHQGLAAVLIDGQWGYINENGSLVINAQFSEVNDFHEGLASVMKVNENTGRYEWAYIDTSGSVVIDYYPYESSDGRIVHVGDFREGIAFVTKSLYTIIGKDGNELFNQYSEYFIHGFNYHSDIDAIRAYVFIDENMTVRKYGLVRFDGEERLEPLFDNVREIKGNYVVIENRINGKMEVGLIGLNNN